MKPRMRLILVGNAPVAAVFVEGGPLALGSLAVATIKLSEIILVIDIHQDPSLNVTEATRLFDVKIFTGHASHWKMFGISSVFYGSHRLGD
jgi:hypothetical protein